MRKIVINNVGLVFVLLFVVTGLKAQSQVTLEKVVNEWSFHSPSAEKIRLAYDNIALAHENYLKGFLPSIAFNINPVSFNHSLRLMQSPTDGSYSYVNDYSNTSNAGLSIQQKVGITGGVFSVNSNLSVLTEFSTRRNSFNATPLSLSYSQQLLGGYYLYKKLKKIEQTKTLNAARQYCSDMADIQIKALNAFLNLFMADITRKLAMRNIAISDTLLMAGKALLNNGHFTEYEFKQVELQANNNRYVYETSQKDYQLLFRELWALLGKKEPLDSLDVVVPDFSLPLTIDYETVVKYAQKNNPFALSQEARRLEAEQTLYSAKLANRFNGNISVSYGLNQYAEHFSDAYRKPDYSQGVMIGFQIPVFQWGINRNKLQMAKNNYRNTMLELEEQETSYANDLLDKVDSYNHGVKLYFLSNRSYQLAQEQYQILSAKFKYGKVSIYEITSAQKDLYEALKKYYSTMQTVWNQYFMLRKMTLYDFIHQSELMHMFHLQ
ncbi:TolC family protein [Bacteroides acidifaciens]|uniref:TolC family protein n=1 Tax=Bacteroides acidifaciens TaxID=85831 RepID=UPI00214A0E6F|nr:TolC family protein [Bacteroides acidifaciens]MCR2005166.1 TolC family protein [Bacteroides acidifaciens]